MLSITPRVFASLILDGLERPVIEDEWEAIFNVLIRMQLAQDSPTPAQLWRAADTVARRFLGDGIPRDSSTRAISWGELRAVSEAMARKDHPDIARVDPSALPVVRFRFGYAFRRLVLAFYDRSRKPPSVSDGVVGHCPYCFRLTPHAGGLMPMGSLCSVHLSRRTDKNGSRRSNPDYHAARRLNSAFIAQWQEVRLETRFAFLDPTVPMSDFPVWLRRYYRAASKRYPTAKNLLLLLQQSDDPVALPRALRDQVHQEFAEDPEMARSYLNRLEAWERAFTERHSAGRRGGRRVGAGRKPGAKGGSESTA